MAVTGSSLPSPELAHCISCSCILFELSGAHAGQGRCLTDLRSLFPQAVYHCHSPNEAPPFSLSAFLKINRSASALDALRHGCLCSGPLLPPSCSAHLSLGWNRAPCHLCCCSVASCCSPSSHRRLTGPSQSVSTDKSPQSFPCAPLHDTFAINLFFLGFLSPCLSFPLIHNRAVWKWFWRFSCSVQLPIGDILHSLTFYYRGNTITVCELA